jgi:hypothetical protein
MRPDDSRPFARGILTCCCGFCAGKHSAQDWSAYKERGGRGIEVLSAPPSLCGKGVELEFGAWSR